MSKTKQKTPSIARLLDHALLHPTLGDDAIVAGCQEAAELHVASVCVQPLAVPLAVAELCGTGVAVGTVIGFPQGAVPTEVKVYETEWAVARGAREVDMVIAIGKALAGAWEYVEADIRAVVVAARRGHALVKVILETDFVREDETKRRLCRICDEAGADFVKTSTGFGMVRQDDGSFEVRGATEHDVRLMRESCSPRVGVKASGGIRTLGDARRLQLAGATRLGTSASRAICAAEAAEAGGGRVESGGRETGETRRDGPSAAGVCRVVRRGPGLENEA